MPYNAAEACCAGEDPAPPLAACCWGVISSRTGCVGASCAGEVACAGAGCTGRGGLLLAMPAQLVAVGPVAARDAEAGAAAAATGRLCL